MLTTKLAVYFLPGTRSRGQSYFSSGRVRVAGTTPDDLIEVHVDGTRTYTVFLGIESKRKHTSVRASCDCPYMASYGDFCKHVWAALLAVEKQCDLRDIRQRVYMEALLEPDEDWDPFRDELGRWDGYESPPAGIPGSPQNSGEPKRAVPQVPAWSKLLQDLARQSGQHEEWQDSTHANTEPLEPLYILETPGKYDRPELIISLGQVTFTSKRRIRKFKRLPLKSADIRRLATEQDRLICLMLAGAGAPDSSHRYDSSYRNYDFENGRGVSKWVVPPDAVDTLLPMLFDSGRLMFRTEPNREPEVIKRDDGDPWELFFALDEKTGQGDYSLTAKLRRNGESKPVTLLQHFLKANPTIMIAEGILSRVHSHGCFHWLSALKDRPATPVKNEDRSQILKALTALDCCPPIAWPKDWQIEDVADVVPRPKLLLSASRRQRNWEPSGLPAAVKFLYGEMEIAAREPGRAIADPSGNRRILRHRDVESRYLNRARELGVELCPYTGNFLARETRVPEMVSTLVKEGWVVLGEGKFYRTGGQVTIDVSTGIDWFDIDGQVDFDGQTVTLPDLLKALHRGEKFVKLGDGSLGLLPEEWLARHADLLGLGRIEDGQVRFAKTQLGLIDALLAQMPEARFDDKLAEARDRLQNFTGIQPHQAPQGFTGALRPYQELGMAWLDFLNKLGWSGCLADDMGLGKTVQVLAMLLNRKQQGPGKPSLAVVPKSIIFNWKREAERFVPQLRVLDYTGTDRADLQAQFKDHDLIVTTYGTCRRDIDFLRTQDFDYAILDEAQAIKNPASLNAKASRLLSARHRLAMTGTPVENHLGDLWSLFEFLNPGMLGNQASFKATFQRNGDDDRPNTQFNLLHRMLRPFILRRTKAQVAPELPERSEQTIECVMPQKQAAYYTELRDYYRLSLLGRVAKDGMAKSKIHVLEALLRLRQAACHPGLIDQAKLETESAKLDALLPMLAELREEGHKALVFSQFTSLLAILRHKLDDDDWTYEYLDGQTHDRQQCVDRFQTDPKCPLFLISLKAGGLGLNLTAAGYVFILDPWWNPAVEAQAIDRAHRIGQDKKVMAYRLIARDTVEAKIIQLQKSKRDLADAIITQANSLIQNLTREDLEILLS